jgi:hypothetical protein
VTRAGLAPGDVGNVAFVTKNTGVVLARVRFRREDGTEGRVSRTGKTKAAARRAVMEAARDQMKDFELDAELTLTQGLDGGPNYTQVICRPVSYPGGG